MSFNSLQNDLEQRVREFIQDRFVWQTYVAENFEQHTNPKVYAELSKRYRIFIDKYCATGKTHLNLTLGPQPDLTPDEEHIVKFEKAGDKAIVFTEVRKDDGWMQPHQYEFTRENSRWVLDGVYYYYYHSDEPYRYACL